MSRCSPETRVEDVSRKALRKSFRARNERETLKKRTAGDTWKASNSGGRTNDPPAGNARLGPRDAYITTVLILKRESIKHLGPLTTGVDRLLDQAAFAGDLATPPEPALAVDLLFDDPGVVSPAAAKQLATVHPLACGVTAASLGS